MSSPWQNIILMTMCFDMRLNFYNVVFLNFVKFSVFFAEFNTVVFNKSTEKMLIILIKKTKKFCSKN